MSTLLNYIYLLITNRASFLVAGYSILLAIGNYFAGIMERLGDAIASFDALATPAFEGSGLAVSPFSLMNYIVPLDLGITLFVAWLALWLACSTVRIVKAWIPTVS